MTEDQIRDMIKKLMKAQKDVLTQTEKDIYSAKIKALYWVLQQTTEEDLLEDQTYN